ncbi:DUF6907 domain-containing protein [Nonomuraea sp. NPDC003754]
MSARHGEKTGTCPAWCTRRHPAPDVHVRNLDAISGPPFSTVTVEVNLLQRGDLPPVVQVWVTDEAASIVGEETNSRHELDEPTAAALGHAITKLDPRGVREVGLALVDAAELLRGGAA